MLSKRECLEHLAKLNTTQLNNIIELFKPNKENEKEVNRLFLALLALMVGSGILIIVIANTLIN